MYPNPILHSIRMGNSIGFYQNRKLKIRRETKTVKTNSSYYQEKIFHRLFTEEINFFFSNDFERLKMHQVRAASHTSKTTTAFLLEKKTDTLIAYIDFQHIPSKSLDLLCYELLFLVLLKRGLSQCKTSTFDGQRKVVKKEQQAIILNIWRKSLQSWKALYRHK